MINSSKSKIPVLMFYNIDHFEWSEKDQNDVLELVQALNFSLMNVGHSVIPLQLENSDIAQLFSPYDPNDFVVFNWCEGIPGIPHSFGKAARALEELGFSFTGSPAHILELNDDKRRVKKILTANNVMTPSWRVFRENYSEEWDHFPAIVKPAFEHCSVGITPDSIVNNTVELKERAGIVKREFNQPVIIEEFIAGREFQVGVLGNEKIEVFPPVEADFSQLEDPRDHICTMDSKDDPTSYRFQKWNMIVPAQLSRVEIDQLDRLCIQAYQTIGVRDYARMDVRLRNGCFYILDVNTNPYIGPECGLIQASKLAGYSYGEFGSRLVSFAWQRKNPN
jgi:D-alanine-D-alanine ligase